MLISWTFHGGNVFGATKRSWKVLHKHLGKLLSTHMISDFFLSYGATTFSKIVAFFAWMWLDRVLAAGGGEAPITMGRTTVHQVYVFLMMISYTIALRFPLVTIFFIGTCGSWITNNTAMAYLGGMFLGAITCLVLNAAAQIVLSSTDTIFYCFALEQHAGKTTEGRDDVYRLILDCKKEAGETNEKNDAPASGEANENANGTEMAAVTEPISEGTDVV
jgi:hypothetical protein